MIGVKTGLDISSVNKTKQEFTKLLSDLQNQANRNPIRINISNTTSQINNITNSIRNLGGSANNTSNSFKGLGSSIGSLTAFYTRWLSVSSAVNLALLQTRNAIKFAFEQDERVRNISMITGEDRKTVQGYTQDWLNLGLELKQSTSIVAESNEEWLRAGANLSEINELTKMTIKTSEIAGSNIKETTSQAIALKNAYGLTNNELKNVLDSVVKMDNTSSTGTDRLMRSLLVASASAKQAKVPIDWLVSGLTTVQSKSKQTAESVGKNFRNIFLNMTKMTNGENQVGLSKAEDMLNKINIAMRSNATTFRSADKILDDLAKKWSTLTEVQQAELGTALAQKENINTFNILMQNQAETLKNLNNVKSAGGSIDKAYLQHLSSANGALGDLKNTLEQLYIQMVNGDVLKKVLNDLTSIVKVVEFLITDGKNSTKVWIGMLIAVKNFKLIEIGIMGCVTAFKYLKAFGLEALTLLNLNPIILGFTALIAVVTAVTYSQYKHSKQVKELKTEYNLLNKAMSEMNGDEIKNNTEKLKEQQKELDKLAKMANVQVDLGYGVKDDSGQRRLDKFIKTLEEGGFHVDKVKNSIIELANAESNIATSDTINSIQDKTNATIEESNETQSLISQYQSLAQQENLSAEKKKLLSGLTQQLVGRVDGLTTSVDKHGNMVITNTKHLNGQIDVLELLKQQAIITGNTEIEMAINSASAIHNGTIQTLDDMKSKLISYQTLSNALSNTSTGKNGFFSTELTALKMGSDNLQSSIDRIEALKSKFSMKAPAVSGITSASPSGYTPTATSSKDKANKQDIENLDLKLEKNYKLEGALKDVNLELERNNKLQSSAEGKVKIDLLNEEIKLMQDKKNILSDLYKTQQLENRENVKALSSKGFTFNKTGQVDNKIELLQSKNNQVNKLYGDAKKQAQEEIKSLESLISSYENLRFSKMTDTSSKIFDLEQDRISKLKDIEIEKIDIISKANESSITNSEKILSNLDSASKYNANDNISQLEILKQKEATYKDEIARTNDTLKKLNSTQATTVEGQKELDSSIESTTETLRNQTTALLDTQQVQEDMAKTMLTDLLEAQQKVDEELANQRHKTETDKLTDEKKVSDFSRKIQLQIQQDIYDAEEKSRDEAFKKSLESQQDNFDEQKKIADKAYKAQLQAEQDVYDAQEKLRDEAFSDKLKAQQEAFDAQKKLDDKAFENKLQGQTTDLSRDVYKVSESDWNMYKASKIAQLQKDITDLANIEGSGSAIEAKQTEIDDLNQQMYSDLTDYENAYKSLQQVKIDAIDAEIEALNKKNDLEEENETRLKNQNDLIEKQKNLTNVQNERSQNIYKDGKWQWTVDEKAVKEAQDAVNEQIESNNNWEKDIATNHKIELLNQEKQYEQDLIDAKAGLYTTLEAKLKLAQEKEQSDYDASYKLKQKALDVSIKAEQDAYDLAEKTRQIARDLALQTNQEAYDLAWANKQTSLDLVLKAQQDSYDLAEKNRQRTRDIALQLEQEAYDLAWDKKATALQATQEKENKTISQHYSDMKVLTDTSLESLKVQYGENWDKILGVIKTKLDTAKQYYIDLQNLALATAGAQASLQAGALVGGGSGGSSSNNTGGVTIGGSSGGTWTASQINNPAYQEAIRQAVVGGGNIAQFAEGGQLPLWGSQPKLAYVDEGEVINNKIDSQMLLKASEMLKTIDINRFLPKINIPDFSNFSRNQASEIKSGDTYNFNNVKIEAQDVSSFVNQMKTFVAVH